MATETRPAAGRREVPLWQRDLPETDEVPMETPWHRKAMNQLLDCVSVHRRRQGRRRFYAGGNMFVYFSEEQVRNKDYRGPDFFFVEDVDPDRARLYWAIWDEGGRFPDLIIELISSSTAEEDRTTKKDLYEKTFRTREYFLCDPETGTIEGWRLGANDGYVPVEPDQRGRLECEVLGLWLGMWEGTFQDHHAVWPRFFYADGRLVPTLGEAEREQKEQARAQAEQARAQAEQAQAQAEQAQAQAEQAQTQTEEQRRRAEEAEAALAELRRELAAFRAGPQPPPTP